MRIVVITQNEPFYLGKNFDYLIKILPAHSKIVGCVLTAVSPFGKKESFFRKAVKTYKIFGINFFMHYSIKYIFSIFDFRNKMNSVLKYHEIPKITISENINSPSSINIINSYKPDILVSVLGNQIFKKQIINLAPMGCINLHTALLPKYRGLMPTFWVLKNNEKRTGVSVFYVDEGIDSGPIITQKEIKINNQTHADLIRDTKRVGMELIAKSIDLIHHNKVKLIENPNENSSYYSFPSRKDVIEFKNNNKFF